MDFKTHPDKTPELSPWFQDFAKTTKEILDPQTNEFNINAPSVIFRLNNPSQCNTEITLDKNADAVSGKFTQKLKRDNFEGRLDLKSEREAILSLAYRDYIPNATASFEAKKNQPGRLSFAYRNPVFATNFDLLRSVNGDFLAASSLVLYCKKFAFGCKADLNLNGEAFPRQIVNDYFMGASYSINKAAFSLYAKDKLSTLNADFLYKMTPRLDLGLSLASKMAKEYLEGVNCQVGMKLKYNENLLVRAKLSTSGTITSAFTRKLAESVSATFFSQFNLQPNEKARMGIRFEFSEELRHNEMRGYEELKLDHRNALYK